jgi:penicillin-binding protein 1A
MKAAFEGWGTRIGERAKRVGRFIRRRPIVSAAMLPLALVVYVAALFPFTPSIGNIKKAKQEHPTVVLSADGKELAVFKRANRDWVKLTDVSPKVVEALLATEDHRFYEHHGLDFTRTAKAALNTFKGDVQGGSTITQQLARNLYPEEIGREQTITRKVKEAITAFKIEAVYSKDEILETYLNSVSFLYNAWGIEMAARTYFDKPASKLNELEAATLVGMLKGTSFYNPVLNPERALQRRNTVLALMVKHNTLPEARYEQLKAQPLKLDFERQPEFNGPAPHLAEYLRRWLLDWADKHDYNIYADGLVVRTTIDSRMQKMANEAVERQGDALQAVADVEWSRSAAGGFGTDPQNYVAQRGKSQGFEYFWNTNQELVKEWIRGSSEFAALKAQGESPEEAVAKLRADADFMKGLRKQKTTLQAGFLAIEPQTGYIKAWVGSRDYNEDKFDHVQQARRQPGSTFKPFVYGAAFEMGHQPNETLMDQPVAIQIDKNQVWRPGDIEGAPTNQPMTLRDGLSKSKNTITAQLMMQVGPSRVASLARAMGVRQSKLQEVPSLALGTSPVTLKEMVTAFSSIANGGSYIEPVLVAAIEDRDHGPIETFHAQASEQAMSNQAAMTLLDVMRGVIDSGTAVGLKPRFGLSGDLAGKTGTTQDNTDGWFILMHPQLVAGAWMGFNDNRVTMRSSYWGQGAHNALLVVGDFMQQSTKAGLTDTKASFAAPRMQDQEQPLLQGVKDWWNSVFSAPSGGPEVAAMPPVNLDPPVLIPAPRGPDSQPLVVTTPAPPVTADAPVIVEAQRVPSFPRPLESARPAESIPGTQVYSQDGGARSGYGGSAGASSGGTVLVPRSLQSADGSAGSQVVRVLPSTAGSGYSQPVAPNQAVVVRERPAVPSTAVSGAAPAAPVTLSPSAPAAVSAPSPVESSAPVGQATGNATE